MDLHGLHVSEAIVEIIKMRKWMVAAPLDSVLLASFAVRALPAMLFAYYRGHHSMEDYNSFLCYAIQPVDTIQQSFPAEQQAVSGCAPVVDAKR